MHPLEAVEIYRELLLQLPDMIKKSGLKDKFIYEKMEMPKPTFYRKMRESTWSVDEVEKILKIIVNPYEVTISPTVIEN
jgi:hypothetical protein